MLQYHPARHVLLADLDSAKVSQVLKAIGLGDELARSTIRIGLGRFNTEEEIEYAGEKIVEAVHAAARIFATVPHG